MSLEITPNIVAKPKLRQSENGNHLIIECEIEASPKPEVKWYKWSYHLNDSDRLMNTVIDKGNNIYKVSLDIDCITSDDSGQYKVVARNRLGGITAAIVLYFSAETAQEELQEGLQPSFLQKPTIRSEADGTRLCFECQIKSDPKPELYWYKDNVRLLDEGRNLIYCDNIGNNSYFACLEIDDVTIEDAGNYKIHAQNDFGESNASIRLNFDSEQPDNQKFHGPGGPVFIDKPFLRQFENKILFECKVSADPTPGFTWLFHNHVISEQSSKYRQRILTHGTTHTLILEIDNLVSSDSGDYKIKVKNRSGEADSTINLNIETSRTIRLPDGLSPYFTSRPKIIQTKDSLMIQLAVSANLTPSASWFLGHKNLEELGSNFSSKMERKSIDNYLLSMEIQNPLNSDAGLYKCVVANELGECIANISLQFQGEQAGVEKNDALTPAVIEKPRIIKFEAQRMVRFETRWKAKPQMDISWFKEKIPIFNNEKYKIDCVKESDNNYILSLEIANFSPEDSGFYKVQGKNEAGQSNANIHVHVEV